MNPRKDLAGQLAAIHDRLGTAQGKRYWRSLDELAEGEAFQELMRQEFPEQADVWPESLSRRKFLALMSASLALAGLGGCSARPAPSVDLVPYAHPPAEVVPGRPLFFATTMTHAGSGVGLLVESHTGRPTKIEGNPDHPASRGATNIYHQASVLALYDPDRAKNVTRLGQTRTWPEFSTATRDAVDQIRKAHGAGLRILTPTIASPTLARQFNDLLKELPDAGWHVWEPLHRDTARQGARLAFGEPVDAIYDFTKANVILSLDADFLDCGRSPIPYAADFVARRRVRTGKEDVNKAAMNRLYVAETAVSTTGAKADHRLALRPSEIEMFARSIAARCGVSSAAAAPAATHEHMGALNEKWIAAVAKDLERNREQSLVVAGDTQPPVVHLLAHALNDHLGNVGKTVHYQSPIDPRPDDRTQSLRELIDDIKANKVRMLLILGGNPAYTAPVDLEFAGHVASVDLCIHHSLYSDETSRLCHWHLPETHYLEAWGDARAYDGTASLVQPLISPLYDSRSAHELLALLFGQETPGRDIVRQHWRQEAKARHEASFERFWRASLHNGVIADTAFKPRDVKLAENWQSQVNVSGTLRVPTESGTPPASGHPVPDTFDLVVLPDPTIYDGEFANNGWLQELPKPVTKLAWGNGAILSPATARQLGVTTGEYAHGGEHGGYYMPVLDLELGDRNVSAPAWIVPGHADGTVTIFLGNGRRYAGRVGGQSAGENIGFDAYPLRTSRHPWAAAGLKVSVRRETELVCCTQSHHAMEERQPVRAGTLTEYKKTPDFATEPEREKSGEEGQTGATAPTLYRPFDYGPPKNRWGMSIDLTACVGCQACIVACQAENNIPVVGKEQVSRGREMHWLRVDRYVSGTPDDPKTFHFQPVPCMHCENAPCEYVCPVAATVHSAEGLNDMLYQRCVGTRFCSNNCPYKVRRFNFLLFSEWTDPTVRLQYNPEVTVRSRGVMEKCSYCVQRIRRAEIDAQNEKRPIRDGEVLTACQAACPTQAIVFGDINDLRSLVKQEKDSPLSYALLADANTRPRTTYLGELRNPNPDLEEQEK